MNMARASRLAVTSFLLAAMAVTYYFFSQNNDLPPQHVRLHRQLSLLPNNLNAFNDPKSVSFRTNIPANTVNSPLQELPSNNDNNVVHSPQTTVTTDMNPYTIDHALLAMKAFRSQVFFFVYDAQSDEFVAIHNTRVCDFGCVRIFRIAPMLSFALRQNFPERFRGLSLLQQQSQQQQQQPQSAKIITANNDHNYGGEGAINDGSSDLVFIVSSGDIPRLRQPCLIKEHHCHSEKFSPILQFGSVYSDPKYFPTMIPMPQPVRPHVPCFEEWQRRGTVCQDLQPRQIQDYLENNNDDSSGSFQDGLVFGEELGLSWDQLIPQLIWRGTDFAFLHTMFPEMRAPKIEVDIEPKISSFGINENNPRGAIDALWDMGDEVLLPRWRGVLLTSEAELEAKENNIPLPWVNIKFTSASVNGIKTPTSQIEEYQRLEQLGIRAVGEPMTMVDQAKYKYHIDLGGGGGTTWTGTIEKLALPGLLFHHVTPSKDWFHQMLEPWIHYVPVNTDLSDLRKKFDWAESHPVEAKQIADNGTQFARMMGTPEGFSTLYNNYMRAPLEGIISAYRPKNGPVLSVLVEQGGQDLAVVARCSGRPGESCIRLDGADYGAEEEIN